MFTVIEVTSQVTYKFFQVGFTWVNDRIHVFTVIEVTSQVTYKFFQVGFTWVNDRIHVFTEGSFSDCPNARILPNIGKKSSCYKINFRLERLVRSSLVYLMKRFYRYVIRRVRIACRLDTADR